MLVKLQEFKKKKKTFCSSNKAKFNIKLSNNLKIEIVGYRRNGCLCVLIFFEKLVLSAVYSKLL